MNKLLCSLVVVVAALGGYSLGRAAPGPERAPGPAKTGREAAAGQKVVEEGDRVHVEYIGRLEDGSVFERSVKGKPLVFTVGSGQIKGFFDQSVRGMKLREEKLVILPCKDAYGERDSSLIRAYPRSLFPAGYVPEIGKTMSIQLNKEKPQQPATVVDTTTGHIILDLNHPLTGHDLTYTLKVIVIELPQQ